MADNLIQKNGESTWYVRLAVPVDVQQKLGCKVLVQSLKTGMRGEAMTRRLPILHEWKTLIAKARTGTPLPADWQDSLSDTLATAALITRANKMVSIGEEPSYPFPMPDPAEVARIMDNNPRLVASLRARIAKAHQTPMGLINFDEEIGEMFKRMMVHRYETAYTPTPEQREEIRVIAADPASRKPRSPITPARIKAFREFREARGGVAKHVSQQVTRLEKLSEFLKGNDLALSFDSVDLWIKSLNRAPATLAQHLMAGTAFWKWATKYDPALRDELKTQTNPFANHDLPQGGGKETSGQRREIYRPADAFKLYSAAVEAGNLPLADLIQLGWYTGARIEELCRIRKVDVVTIDGIVCLDIQRGKNRASERVVPLHPAMQQVVERLIAASTDEYLIPVSGKLPHGKRSHALSKAFGRLRTAAGFGPLHVFHGFRHTAVTTLIREGVADGLVKELVGHDADDVTRGVYSRGSTAKQKFAAISKIPLIILGD